MASINILMYVYHLSSVTGNVLITEETSDMFSNHITIFFQGKVTRIQQMKFNFLEITLIGMGTVCWEDFVVLSPNY